MGYSVIISVDYVDSKVYGSANALPDCVIDGQAFARQVVGLSHLDRQKWLQNQNATKLQVRHWMLHFAKKAVSGDWVYVHYSGHGGQVVDKNNDELDGLDETWCLYDGEMVDDEIHEILGKFSPGVNVVVFSDSCHSGTVTRMVQRMPVESTKVGLWGRLLNSIGLGLQKSTGGISANVLLLSGCMDSEFSESTGTGGVFTKALLRVWPKAVTWGGLHVDINYIMKGKSQKCNFFVLGKRVESDWKLLRIER